MTNDQMSGEREQTLQAFETAYALTLPQAYRHYLLQTGGQTPQDNAFFVDDGDERWETTVQLFDLRTGAYCVMSVPTNFEEYRGRILAHLVPIGVDPGGNLVCISLAEETHGHIYFAHHDYFAYGGEEPADFGVFRLAPSFDEFLTGLARPTR